MFVIELTYTAPLDRVDALLAEHSAWLDEHYAAGLFLASGRKIPRDGGLILTGPADRATVEAAVAGDPFRQAGIAEHRIVEFRPTRTVPDLEAYRVPVG